MQLNIDENLFEHKSRDFSFPLNCSLVRQSAYDDGRFSCHWHAEPELTLVLSGEMEYQANDRICHLSAGSGIFVNSSVIHAGWRFEDRDCIYLSISFDPVLIYGYEGCTIYEKNVRELLCAESFPSLYLDPADGAMGMLLESCRTLDVLQRETAPVRELLMKAELCRLWAGLDGIFRLHRDESEPVQARRTVSRIKDALLYMEDNYKEKLTLDQIAASCNISKSVFCRCFRQLMHQTPFEYLMRLRIRRSLPLLLEGSMSMVEISEASGFSGPSYYAEIFRRFMDMPPTAYIRQQREKADLHRDSMAGNQR